MRLPPKEIVCKCGHASIIESKKLLCVKCGKYIFYDPQEKRRYQIKSTYVVVMFALALGFLTYVFIEMIATPLLGR